MRRGSTDLSVIHADNSGVYLQEGHAAVKTYFVIGGSMRSSAKLVKLDKNFTEIFTSDFNRELKGKEFVEFFVLQKKVFIIASELDKKAGVVNIHAAEIDRSSGELAGDWIEIAAIEKDEKRADVNIRLVHNADSTHMVIVSSVEGKGKNNYRIQEFNASLKSMGNAITLTNEFDPKTFQLEDLLYTNNSRIILVGRIYEYREGRKKKEKFLDFANYNIRIYDNKGQQIKELNTSVNGKWLTSTQLLQEKDKDLVLAAFYSNDKKDKTIDGMLVQRINSTTGDIISTTEKAIDKSLLTTDGADSMTKVMKKWINRRERKRSNWKK